MSDEPAERGAKPDAQRRRGRQHERTEGEEREAEFSRRIGMKAARKLQRDGRRTGRRKLSGPGSA